MLTKTRLLLTFIAMGVLIAAVSAKEKPPKPPKPAQPPKIEQELMRVLEKVAEAEPDGVGPYHDALRGAGRIINNPTPAIVVSFPEDGSEIVGTFVIEAFINNWIVDPSRATSAGTEFAVGHQEPAIGHTHVWIYDMDTGDRVYFSGASGLLPTGDAYASNPVSLPPGRYKLYTVLQNHDHVMAIPSNAQALPPVDAVAFSVVEEAGEVSAIRKPGAYALARAGGWCWERGDLTLCK